MIPYYSRQLHSPFTLHGINEGFPREIKKNAYNILKMQYINKLWGNIYLPIVELLELFHTFCREDDRNNA